MKFYGLSGLSGRLDTLDTPFRDRIKKYSRGKSNMSLIGDSLDFLDVWTLWTLHLEAESKKIYDLSGLSGLCVVV